MRVLCGWRWTTQGRPAGPAASRLSLPSLHTSSYAHMESAGYGMLRTSFSSQNPDGKVLGAQVSGNTEDTKEIRTLV
ncbi:uncharacterized protein PHA67_003124 isoform 9-T11 [Liasis olivaceus]